MMWIKFYSDSNFMRKFLCNDLEWWKILATGLILAAWAVLEMLELSVLLAVPPAEIPPRALQSSIIYLQSSIQSSIFYSRPLQTGQERCQDFISGGEQYFLLKNELQNKKIAWVGRGKIGSGFAWKYMQYLDKNKMGNNCCYIIG